MIPGLKAVPAFMAGGGSSSALSLSFVAFSTVVSSSSITIPSAAIAGDWAILFDAAYNSLGGSISAVTPGGWTNVANTFADTGSYSIRMMASHRILPAGGAGGTVVTGMYKQKIMLVLRPSTSILTAVGSTWNGEVTPNNPSPQTVAASAVATPLVVFAFASRDSGSAPAFSTETPAMTNLTVTNGPFSIRVGYTIYNSAPSDQSIDIADAGVQGLQSGYVRFT